DLAPMTRMGAPLPKAPRLPSTPALSPISTDPETTTCSVSPPPCVYRISRSRPCLRKMPACWPSSGIAPSQLPRIGDAILRVSAASPSGTAHRTSENANNPRLFMRPILGSIPAPDQVTRPGISWFAPRHPRALRCAAGRRYRRRRRQDGSATMQRTARWAPVLALAALALSPAPAASEDYPNRAVTIVAPSAPGGMYSILARLIAGKLEQL